jgi:hypothetical protein
MSARTEIPDGIRVPLNELQADVRFLFGRVAADGTCSDAMAQVVTAKLGAIETVVLDWHEALIDCLEYFESREDADYDSETGFIPNDEMLMASKIRQLIEP